MIGSKYCKTIGKNVPTTLSSENSGLSILCHISCSLISITRIKELELDKYLFLLRYTNNTQDGDCWQPHRKTKWPLFHNHLTCNANLPWSVHINSSDFGVTSLKLYLRPSSRYWHEKSSKPTSHEVSPYFQPNHMQIKSRRIRTVPVTT